MRCWASLLAGAVFATFQPWVVGEYRCAFNLPPTAATTSTGSQLSSRYAAVVVAAGAASDSRTSGGTGTGNGSHSRPCSVRNQYFFEDADDFHLHTAAECFYYTAARYLPERPCVVPPYVCLNRSAGSFRAADCHLPHLNDPTSGLLRALRRARAGNPATTPSDAAPVAPVTDAVELRWLMCATQAAECCHRMRDHHLSASTSHQSATRLCPATWDGLTCFDDTPARAAVEATCPNFLYAKPPKCQHVSRRQCQDDGTWARKTNGSEEYTDYSGCTLKRQEAKMASVYYFAITLFSLSVLFCLPAIIIFNSFRALRCQRISMHKQLVASVMLSSFMQLVEHSLLTLPDLHQRSTQNWWCNLVLLLQKYFWATQFSWMLCEGVYLHTLVSQAFVDHRPLTSYYVVGWGFPALFVVIYAALSLSFTGYKCWRSITVYDYIVTIPATICLVVNVILMVRVLMVLVGKLRSPKESSSDEASEGNFRRVLRALLLLVPLFGIHYMVSTFASGVACANVLLASYISWFCISSQGIFVSLVLCYCNGEVQHHLQRAYTRYFERRQFESVVSYTSRKARIGSSSSSGGARMSTVTIRSDVSASLLPTPTGSRPHRPSLI